MPPSCDLEDGSFWSLSNGKTYLQLLVNTYSMMLIYSVCISDVALLHLNVCSISAGVAVAIALAVILVVSGIIAGVVGFIWKKRQSPMLPT